MMHLQEMKDVIKRSRELLARPVPNSFAGQKTQEPFPREDDPIRRPDIQNLINSELKPPE
jgi:hypothetical protein